MKLNIFRSRKKSFLRTARVKRIVRALLNKERRSFSNINIVIADDRYMTRLNQFFFKKKRLTNVISFNMGDDCEIYIARTRIKRELDAYYYIVHGLLHAVGYDHLTLRDGSLMNKKCMEYLRIQDSVR